MKDNPYSKMVEIMKEQGSASNPPSIQTGEVISSDPLAIRLGDLLVDEDSILIADYLLKDYKRKIKIPKTHTTGETGDYNGHSHTVDMIGINEVEINFIDTLKKGDLLAVLPVEDRQLYIVLARLKEVS